MQSISIQIQPEFVARFDRHRFITQVNAVERSPEIDEFTEKGQTYLQFHFFTEFPKRLWADLRKALYNHPDYSAVISPISIAVYDDQGADSFAILHHFDQNEIVHTPF